MGFGVGSLPYTEAAAAQVLSLPMYPELDIRHVEAVAEAIYAWQTDKA
jgi:dTDP-4-amino-4,6-dideoxygalactose transaminase